MKIKLLKSDRLIDGKHHKAGAVIDVADQLARYLIGVGQAEPAKAKADQSDEEPQDDKGGKKKGK